MSGVGLVLFGVLGLAVLYAGAEVADAVAGQPRQPNGNFRKKRTTMIEDGLRLIGAILILVVLLDIVFREGV